MDLGSVFTSAASGAAGGSLFGLPGSVVGGLVSGAASLLGGSATNAANEQMQSRQFVDNAELQVQAQQYNDQSATTAFNRSQAQWLQQTDYNQAMANTAYQRSVADEKAAGLNPILGIAQGGAASPPASLASPASPTSGASSVGAPTMQNVIGPAISSAMQGFKLAGDLQAQSLENKILDNKVTQSGYEASNAAKTGEYIQAQTDSANKDVYVKGATAQEINQRIEKRDRYGSGGNQVEAVDAAGRRISEAASTPGANPGLDLNNPLAGLPTSLGDFLGAGKTYASPHFITGDGTGGATLTLPSQ